MRIPPERRDSADVIIRDERGRDISAQERERRMRQEARNPKTPLGKLAKLRAENPDR